MSNLINLCLGHILRQFNTTELSTLAQVNSDWKERVEIEKSLRSFTCFTISRPKYRTRLSWFNEKRKIIEDYKRRNCLIIFFTNDKEANNFQEKCVCRLLPTKCYFINLECYAMTDQPRDNILSGLYISRSHSSKIQTFTFIIKPDDEYLYCQELRLSINPHFKTQRLLKDKFKEFLDDGSNDENLMIIFYKKESLHLIKEMLEACDVWFPTTKINIWGGITDFLKICHTVSLFDRVSCKVNAEYVLFLLKNQNIRCYTEMFEDSCNTEAKFTSQLKFFKELIILRKYSIAFMYISSYRAERFYIMMTSKFEELFPNVKLHTIYGEAPFVGEDLREVMSNLPVSNKPHIFDFSTIMLITFNKI